MRTVAMFSLLSLACAVPLTAQTITLKMTSEGAAKRMRGTIPQQIKLSSEPPSGLKTIPADISAPLFGVIEIGPKEEPTRFFVVVDEPEGKPARLFADTNTNGDLTDDPPAAWKPQPYQGNDGKTYTPHRGRATVNVRYGTEAIPFSLNFERSDKNDPARTFSRESLMYAPDYAREGELKLGAKTFKIMLMENLPKGDFRGKPNSPASGVRILIDRNENGQFESVGESYDIAQPFNHGGISYEIVEIAPSGASFTLRRSARAVAEIPPPPDLRPGKKTVSFTAKTLTGSEVRFPEDYKGKLVLLQFWSSWCGDCAEELPYLTQAYQTYHEKGLDMLGVSLDFPNAKLAPFLKAHKMDWSQIYDGKSWMTELVKKHLVTSIPTAFLVDGDTGEILAVGADVLHEKLSETIARALEKKYPSTKP